MKLSRDPLLRRTWAALHRPAGALVIGQVDGSASYRDSPVSAGRSGTQRARDLLLRRCPRGRPVSFDSVRDLGSAPVGCPREFTGGQGCPSAWLPDRLTRRTRPADLATVDALIMAGVATSRAEVLRWAVGRIRENPAYTELQERAHEIDDLKAQF